MHRDLNAQEYNECLRHKEHDYCEALGLHINWEPAVFDPHPHTCNNRRSNK